MRKKTVAANWKMNMTRSEAKSLLGELVPMIKDTDTDIIICAPFLTIQTVLDCVEGTDIHVGAENMYFEDKGAYTGEISPVMLKEAGVTHVILGHSERRKYFGETNEIVNKKIIKALEYGLVPMACCGESLEIRGDGLAKQSSHRQIMEYRRKMSAAVSFLMNQSGRSERGLEQRRSRQRKAAWKSEEVLRAFMAVMWQRM